MHAKGLVATVESLSRPGMAEGERERNPSDPRVAHLLAALRPDLMRFALWLTRNAPIAEDIVQETLLRAWRSRKDLKDPSAIRAWLLTIVRREHARLYRRKRPELVSLEDERDCESLQISGGPDIDAQALRQAILRLPLEHREPLVMQVLGGFSTAEIARELDLSLVAVLSRLFRARNRLRAMCASDPAAISGRPG